MKLLVHCLLVITGLMLAGGAGEAPTADFYATVNRGLAYLAQQQQTDGSFVSVDEPGPRLAPTAAALLAFLACGHTPEAGQYNLLTHNAIDFLLRQAPDDGYFGRADSSGMMGQALTTLALAESYGVENDAGQRKQLAPMLHSALQAIVAMQDQTPGEKGGGWNQNGEGHGDLVTTAWAVLALRSLDDAGMNPPIEVMAKAAGFARSCLVRGNGFADADHPPTTQSTAAGVVILLLASKQVDGSAQQLLINQKIGAVSAEQMQSEFIFAYALRLMRDTQASGVLRTLWESLRTQQGEDGSFGGVQPTAMGVLTLSMRERLLPIFSR